MSTLAYICACKMEENVKYKHRQNRLITKLDHNSLPLLLQLRFIK